MAVGRVTPEATQQPHQDSAEDELEPQDPDQQDPLDQHHRARWRGFRLRPRHHFNQLTVEFTKRRTIVFGVGMGVLLYIVGACFYYVGFNFELTDFIVMGTGSLVIGTVFLGVMIGMRCRDRYLAKRALLPGHVLVKNSDSGGEAGYTKYALADNPLKTVIPATRGSIANATMDTLPRKSIVPELRPARSVEPEMAKPVGDKPSPPNENKKNSKSSTKNAMDRSASAAATVPPAASYDRGNSQSSVVDDDVPLDTYQVVSDKDTPPPPLTLPRQATGSSDTPMSRENSVYTEPINVTPVDGAPPKTGRTPSLASATKSGLVTPSDVDTTTVTPTEIDKSVLDKINGKSKHDSRGPSPCDSEA